jgi:hypothetical protein
MMTAPSPEQVAARVAMIRRQMPEARVIGIHTPGIWLGDTDLRVNGEQLPVAFCASALKVSEALVSHTDASLPLVLITNLEESQLSLDVIVRLAGRRLHRIDRWQMVRDLFRARQIDPRLSPHGWIADALLQKVPDGGYRPVASGVLDADTVWTHLCQQHLGSLDGRPDTVALIRWSLCVQHLRRYEAIDAEFRGGLRQRIEDTAGATGTAMLDAMDAGHGQLLLPIGLVCEVLFSSQGRVHLGIAQARARLEPYLAGRMLSTDVGSTWFQASASVLATLPDTSQREWLDRTQKFLEDLKAAEYSALSGFLMSGFNQRLAQLAACLQDVLGGRAALDQLEACANDVRCHAQATRQADRMRRVDMALRLARYLETGPHEARPVSLSRVSLNYAEGGGFVDWARRYLSGGDETEELAKAFGVLSTRVRELRERQNREFARLLADWHKSPSAMEGLLPIEQTMSAIVAKLAVSTPVLLLIIDGMNYAVFHELCDDLRDQGWIELTNQPGRPLPSLASIIPSVTETSRASLLTGKVVRGNSASEKQSFATHSDLLSVSRAGHPPLLFHKGELLEAGATGLSAVVREAIRDVDRKIVGVVLNAVDDHLARSDQLRFSWTVSQFHHLDALLYEARLANRIVAMTSDHGHILEDGTWHLAGGEEERWRAFGDKLAEQELVFEGPRVEQATGVRRIVVPWSETVRYGQKKQGYHGGATPQEVLVPVGVFTTPDRTIVGWEALPDRKPEWWSSAEPPPAEAPAETQDSLFRGMEASAEEEPRADWVGRLLASPVFVAQRRMAGRTAPSNRDVEAFLKTLDQRHNRISRRALAQALGQPDVRMRGILVGLQRLLNVDGYQVVAVDEDAGTIEINCQLLEKQFQV